MVFLKKILLLLLRISISVVLLVLLFKINKIGVSDLFEAIKEADKSILISGFVLFVFSYMLAFYRWNILLKAAGVRIPSIKLVSSFCGGICFNMLLPSTIGGDLVRGADLTRKTSKPKEVIATLFLDRLTGYLGLVLFVLFIFIFSWRLIIDNKIVVYSILSVTAVLIVLLFVLFNKFCYLKVNQFLSSPNAGKIREVLVSLHQEIHFFRNHKLALLNSLLLSLLLQGVVCFSGFLVALSLGIKINMSYFFVFLPVIGVVSLVPISIGGLGVREGMTVLLFKSVGVSKSLAVGMSLLNFSFILIYAFLGGLIYVLTIHNRRLQRDQSSQFHKAAHQKAR